MKAEGIPPQESRLSQRSGGVECIKFTWFETWPTSPTSLHSNFFSLRLTTGVCVSIKRHDIYREPTIRGKKIKPRREAFVIRQKAQSIVCLPLARRPDDCLGDTLTGVRQVVVGPRCNKYSAECMIHVVCLRNAPRLIGGACNALQLQIQVKYLTWRTYRLRQ